jgi:hypothetical protein
VDFSFFKKSVKLLLVSMERHLKQLTIALMYLLILAIIAGGIYLLIKPELPSCSDGIQNQGEVGIDCGGPCSFCPERLRKDLEIIFTEAIETQDNYVDLVAKIKNPNRDWGADSFSYLFELYDVSGNLIVSREGNSYVLPHETKYAIEQRILADSEIFSVEFKITDIAWQELVDYKEVELLVRNLEFKQSENLSQLTGTLENRSSYDLDKIGIYTVLLDKDSNILGAGKTEIRTLLSKESRYFEIKWPFLIEGQIEKADTMAKTNVFLDQNFMRRYREDREKFQEY